MSPVRHLPTDGPGRLVGAVMVGIGVLGAAALGLAAPEGSRVDDRAATPVRPSPPEPAPPAAADDEAAMSRRGAASRRPHDASLLGLPPVDIESRLPRRWLRDDADRYPLEPARWRRRLPRRCRTRGGYRRFCQGERRVAEPHGVAARVATHLGLGHRASAMQVMHDRPLDEWLSAVDGADPDESLTFPVPGGRLGRGFGRVRRGALRHRRHKGVDIGAEAGSPIVAARGGLVVYAGNELTGYGNVALVLHREGFSTLYAHCEAVHVFAGQRVARGQRIAEVGETGFAHAPHLHFEWRQRGWPRDPAPRFRRSGMEPTRDVSRTSPTGPPGRG